MAVHKGVTHRNEPAAKRWFRLEMSRNNSSSYAMTFSNGGIHQFTWGLAYDAGVTGIEIFGSTSETTPGVFSTQSILTTPWGTFNYSTASDPTVFVSRYEVDDMVNTVTSECEFEFSFSELRWYVDTGAGDTLVATITAQTETGSGYLPNNDCVYLGALSGFGSAIPTPFCANFSRDQAVTCDVIFDDFFEYDVKREGIASGGWQYWNGSAKVSDVIACRAASFPASDCECEITPIPLEFSDSNLITVVDSLHQQETKTAVGNFTCTCIGGFTTVFYWYHTLTNDSKAVTVYCTPASSRIKNYNEYGNTVCPFVDSETIENELTLVPTVSYVDMSVGHVFSKTYCGTFIEGEICASVFPPATNPCLPALPVYTDTSCCTRGTYHLYWEPASCVDPPPGGRTVQLQDWRGQLHLASVEAGDVRYRRSNFSIPAPWDIDNLITAFGDVVSAWPGFDPRTLRLRLLVERNNTDHEVWLTTSDDDGKTWKEPVLFMAHAYLPSEATGFNGEQMSTWAEYDSGTSGSMTAKGMFRGPGDTAYSSPFTFKSGGSDLSIADGGMSNVAFARDAQARITFSPVLDGDDEPTVLFSTDDGRTWKAV